MSNAQTRYISELEPLEVDRAYMPEEFKELVEMTVKLNVDPLPYMSREVWAIRYLICQCIQAAVKYDIRPEQYWNGNEKDYINLLTMLSDGFMSPHELLRLASARIPGAVENMAAYHYHKVCVMFEHYQDYKGYVVLKPSAYMVTLFPNSADLLYVYTSEVWSHCDTHELSKPFLVLKESDFGQLAIRVRKAAGIVD